MGYCHWFSYLQQVQQNRIRSYVLQWHRRPATKVAETIQQYWHTSTSRSVWLSTNPHFTWSHSLPLPNKQTNKEYPLRIATSVVFKNPVHTWSSSFCCWEDSSRESFWGKFLSSSITCEGTTRYNMKPPRTWERIAQLFSKLTELARVWVCIFYSQATEL